VAYARGHGALASVAAERALRCEPGYSMAKLLLDGMDRMVTPSELRDVSASVRAGFGLDAVDGWDEDDWDDADWYGEDDWDDPFEAKDTG
jgi:hypothetical protein